jgi:hypothetical protein
MEVRAQHREVTKVQPETYLTPEEERQHAKLKEASWPRQPFPATDACLVRAILMADPAQPHCETSLPARVSVSANRPNLGSSGYQPATQGAGRVSRA